MDSALAKIKELAAAGGDQITRQQLILTLQDLAQSLEDSDDTVNRYGYLHLQTAAAKIGFDMGLFKWMTEAEGPIITLGQLSEKTGGDELFLGRYMSYLASIGMVKQVSSEEYAANRVTKNLSTKVAESGISHCFVTCSPLFQTLPAFLKKTGYKNPNDEMHTVAQDTWNTTDHQFTFMGRDPEKLGFFNDYMASRREPEVGWLSVYPVEEEAKGWDGTRPIYVNIGGGIGHQCAQFKDMYPDLPGRVVLQDLPHSIANALPTPGVDNMAHDFLEPQPVGGAKFYFTRGVMHNHPDHRVKHILENIKAAMAPDSVILLDEWVLPVTGVTTYAATMDLTMMAAFAAMERTERQWEDIFASVGLKLVKTYTYNAAGYESVMDVRLP